MGILITPNLEIPDRELAFRTSPSSGPGGQHVNRTHSRVTLEFDVPGSTSLDETQKSRILEQLATRIDKRGVLRMRSQKHRSQAANRQELVLRFAALLAEALTPRRRRRATRPSRNSKKRRLQQKRRRGEVKRLRGGAGDSSD